jgi:hypothetical protein
VETEYGPMRVKRKWLAGAGVNVPQGGPFVLLVLFVAAAATENRVGPLKGQFQEA